jgi:hypothetical protein
MRRTYCVDRLRPEDADAVAKIEQLVHPSDHRVGRNVIWAQLEETECEGENLSLGLYCGTKLVGYLLLFVLQERRKICEYFDVELPAHLNPTEPVVYAADVGVLAEHRQCTRLLSSRLSVLLQARPDLWQLPLEAFATETLSAFWEARAKSTLKLGWVLRNKYPFDDPQLKQTMYWLSFAPQRRAQTIRDASEFEFDHIVDFAFGDDKISVGVVRTTGGWAALEPYWDNLLQQTEDPTVLQSHAFLRTWWSHFEFAGDPFIVVALRNRLPVGIVPLQIAPARRLGSLYRCLTAISEYTSDADFLIPSTDQNNNIKNAIAAFICAEHASWDYLSLTSRANSVLVQLLRKKLSSSGNFTSITPQEPASHDPLPVRDATEDTGLTQVITCRNPVTAKKALEDYLLVEQAHPIACELEFRLPHRAIVAFWRDLARNCSDSLQLSVIYWRLGDKVMSACLGLIWNNMFHPLRSLPNATQRRVRKIPLDCANTRLEGSGEVVRLKASRKNFKGMLLHLTHFVVRTHLAHAIGRLHSRLFQDKKTTQTKHTVHTFQMLRW